MGRCGDLGPLYAEKTRMKVVTDSGALGGQGCFTSELTPVNHHRVTRFCVVDAVMLAVLFLEMAALMRLVLAK